MPQPLVDWGIKMARAKRMPKAYRRERLIGATEGVGLPVQDQRSKAALEAAEALVARFTDYFILRVATEIGLEECISYAPNGDDLEFDFTELQLVAFVAALAACREYRDGRKAAQRGR